MTSSPTTSPTATPAPQPRRWFARQVVVPLAVAFVSLAAAGLVAGLIVTSVPGSPVQWVDDRVQQWAHEVWPTDWTRTARDFTRLGRVRVLAAVAAGLSLLLCLVRRSLLSLAPIVAFLGTDALVYLLKYSVDRVGPHSAPGGEPAFPSGHMAGVTTICVALVGVAWVTRHRWLGAWLAALSCLVAGAMALAMIFIDAHWLSDIVAGALLGTAWAVAVVRYLPDHLRRARRRDPRVPAAPTRSGDLRGAPAATSVQRARATARHWARRVVRPPSPPGRSWAGDGSAR